MLNTSFIPQIVSIIYSLLIIITFFVKAKIKTVENKIFGMLIVGNFAGLLLDVFAYIFVKYFGPDSFLAIISCRLILIYLLLWIFTMTVYIYVVSNDISYKVKTDDPIKWNKYSSFKKIVICLEFILGFIAILLPMDIISKNGNFYSIGLATYIIYVVSGILIVFWIYCFLKNHNNIKNKKFYPMYAYFALGAIASTIQFFNPQLLIITPVETFVTILMYFTIENPDMKIIELERQVAESAKAASEAKTAFLSSMSHELRTPLNAIVGLSEDISAYKDQVPAEVREDSEDIVNAADTLIDIIGNILDINKIEGGKLEIVESDYNPKHEFESLVKIMRTKIKEKPIEFNTHIDESLPVALFGDRLRIKQVINNFLSNAVKYTDSGRIDFTIKWHGDTNKLEIRVSDTGKGIKPEDMGKLFEKFERLQVEKTSSVQGTGLGLSITKNLIELMNGEVIVDSIYGSGSTFGCIIPQKIGDPSKLEELDTEKQARAKADYTGKHILVVDDNMLNIKVLKKAISTFNFEIDECYDGQAAVDKIKQNHYDVVLMDIMMPGMGGEEALKILKQDPNFNTPVIALTADATTGAKEKYMSEGFVDYLAKPFNRDTIALKLEKIIK